MRENMSRDSASLTLAGPRASVPAKILYVWEFGGGLGHLTTALPLAQEYRRLGHEVSFAVKDLAAARVVLPAADYRIYQAPLCAPKPMPAGYQPVSYAEILLSQGLGDPHKLGALVRAWLDFFELARPDLLVLDFSPIAMLAASMAGIRRCTIGHGFFLPPRLNPVPPFVEGADPARVARSEALLLSAINCVRQKFRRAPLACLAEFFDADLDLLTTWPEIEHYPQRRDATYWGPVLMRGGMGKLPDWPSASGPKLFVYLRGENGALPNVLRAIQDIGAVALVYAPGARLESLERLRDDRIVLSATPYETSNAIATADAVVCNGGFGTVCEALLAGKPMLCLPLHREQQIVAGQLKRLGVAETVEELMPVPQEALGEILNRLTKRGAHRSSAEMFSAKLLNGEDAVRIADIANASLCTLSNQAPRALARGAPERSGRTEQPRIGKANNE
jgi:UDP:flavonoid glycosyltransferase YjiC (YdhE family)